MLSDANQDIFDDMVRRTIKRRLETMETEELLNTLGFLVQRERRKRADEAPAGLYPIS